MSTSFKDEYSSSRDTESAQEKSTKKSLVLAQRSLTSSSNVYFRIKRCSKCKPQLTYHSFQIATAEPHDISNTTRTTHQVIENLLPK
jgi:hypothetical protein